MLKNITYKVAKERDCHHELHRVCGDVKYCQVAIPFHLFVEVPGAKDTDICEVEDAIVAGEFDKLIDRNEDDSFCKLLEKVVIKVRAKAVRIRRLKVEAEDVTPHKLVCRTHTNVAEVEGLDVAEESESGEE